MSWLSYIGILIILVIADQGDAIRLRSKYACQGRTLRIQCMGNGEKIVVKHAIFGRQMYSKCWKYYALQWNVHCEAPMSTSITKAVCDGKKSCSLVASYNFFQGDPCSDTEKYLAVDYICKPPMGAVQTDTACKGSSVHLVCRENMKIHVLYALYGRLDQKTCPKPLSFFFRTDCRAHGSLRKMRKLCNGKTECTVRAKNSMFGYDPCPGTEKYLKIKYSCVA